MYHILRSTFPAHSLARILIHHCNHDGMIADEQLVNIIMDVGRLIAITRLSDQFNLTFSCEQLNKLVDSDGKCDTSQLYIKLVDCPEQ